MLSACIPLVPWECRMLLPLLPKGAPLSALHVQLWQLIFFFFHSRDIWDALLKATMPFLLDLSTKVSFSGDFFLVCHFWHGQFQVEGRCFIIVSLSNFSIIFTIPFCRCIFHKRCFSPYRRVGTSLQQFLTFFFCDFCQAKFHSI